MFLGVAPGVGKTYAMLDEAQRRHARGTDVVIGAVRTWDRPRTQALLAGLEVVRSGAFSADHQAAPPDNPELDLDAMLLRKPDVAVVDELAHTNPASSRNPQRWQDVRELLDAGIDVTTTLNIQELESMADIAEQLTGARPTQSVPDSFVSSAQQIQLVDVTPEALSRRLAHGNIYAPESVDAALGGSFQVQAIDALRQLALTWLADRIADRRGTLDDQPEGVGPSGRGRIMVALSGGDEGDALLRRASAEALRTRRDWIAVHVVSAGGMSNPPAALLRQQRLTADLGGTYQTIASEDAARAVADAASNSHANVIMVGESRRPRFVRAFKPGFSERLMARGSNIDVHVVPHGFRHEPRMRGLLARRLTTRRQVSGLIVGIVLPIVVIFCLLPFESPNDAEISVVLLAMLVAVMCASLLGGLIVAVISSLWATVLTNYWFIPPENTFVVAQPQNAVALIMFILVGCTVAVIVDRSRAQTAEASARRSEADALAALSSTVMSRDSGWVQALLEQACRIFDCPAAALIQTRPGDREPSVIASFGDTAFAGISERTTVVDSGAGLSLALEDVTLSESQARIASAYAAQAVSLRERDQLAQWAAEAARMRAGESARRTLLAAVSHDLRTPIAGIKAALSTASDETLDLTTADRQQLLEAAEQGADRLNSLVENLLDMNRLQAGEVVPLLRPVAIEAVITSALPLGSEGKFVLEFPANLPLVVTDPALLERILANVLENAVRQESDGRPVRVSAARLTLPAPRVDISVADQGPGITGDERTLIFEPFRQAGDRKESRSGGFGLGLAVAAGLADVIGATIVASDTPGGGLTMSISVPLDGPRRTGGVGREQ